MTQNQGFFHLKMDLKTNMKTDLWMTLGTKITKSGKKMNEKCMNKHFTINLLQRSVLTFF